MQMTKGKEMTQALDRKILNSVRTGSAMALLIPLFFTFASVAASVSVHWLTESALSKLRRENTDFTVKQNMKEISRIQNLSRLAANTWGDGTGRRSNRPESELAIEEFARQFSAAETRTRCEDIFYITLLNDGFSEKMTFSAKSMTEIFKANIETAAKRLVPEWGKGRNDNKLLVLVNKFDQPETGRWILVPSLRHLPSAVQKAPLLEKLFMMLLYSRFYTGVGEETARKTWDRLRQIEMSNTGRDHLGMYPGNSIF
jgi:hypothetical protein